MVLNLFVLFGPCVTAHSLYNGYHVLPGLLSLCCVCWVLSGIMITSFQKELVALLFVGWYMCVICFVICCNGVIGRL